MNKKQSQSGFAHLVIIIVLIVVIIGLLGFVFWRNFIQPKASDMNSSATTSTSVETTTNAIALSESVTDKYNNTGLTLKYPKSWTIEESSVGDSNNGGLATINITSPDGQVIVETEFSNQPQFGTGAGDEEGQISRVVETENITGMSGCKFVSYVLQSTLNSQLTYVTGVFKNDAASTIIVGNEYSGLEFYSHNHAGFFNIGNKGDVVRVNINNNVTNSNYANNKYSTNNDIDDFINTENYKTAKLIVESLYIK